MNMDDLARRAFACRQAGVSSLPSQAIDSMPFTCCRLRKAKCGIQNRSTRITTAGMRIRIDNLSGTPWTCSQPDLSSVVNIAQESIDQKVRVIQASVSFFPHDFDSQLRDKRPNEFIPMCDPASPMRARMGTDGEILLSNSHRSPFMGNGDRICARRTLPDVLPQLKLPGVESVHAANIRCAIRIK
jgi:hypothetical protein